MCIYCKIRVGDFVVLKYYECRRLEFFLYVLRIVVVEKEECDIDCNDGGWLLGFELLLGRVDVC